MASRPVNKAQERVQKSLRSAVKKGNVDFTTLRIKDDGSVEAK